MKKIIISVLSCFFITGVSFADDLFERLSKDYDNVKVERVIKSDLIVLEGGKKIRLIGVKAFDEPRRKELPERDKNGFVIEGPVSPVTAVEDLASDFVQDLLLRKKVKVEFDMQSTDENGYSWGYVFLSDGTMANAEILRQGYAQLQIRPPNNKYTDLLREAYLEARQEKRGIHSE